MIHGINTDKQLSASGHTLEIFVRGRLLHLGQRALGLLPLSVLCSVKWWLHTEGWVGGGVSLQHTDDTVEFHLFPFAVVSTPAAF